MLDTHKMIFNQRAMRHGKIVEGSNVFLSIYTGDYRHDPHCALELGVAIMLNKPIYLLVPFGVIVSEHLKKIAVQIEYYEKGIDDDFKRASTKITKSIVGLKK